MHMTDNVITKEWSTLINPMMPIPGFITSLTGIDAQMVADSPVFPEVAREIHEMLEGRIFVAHNVGFDYNFLKRAFNEIGGAFRYKKLCTVRLGRKLIPGQPTYSLGLLCRSLGITINDRHRALGDAKATALLMQLYIKNDTTEQIQEFLNPRSREMILPPNLARATFNDLPHDTGVYYFHDSKGKVIYVGKAVDIKNRVTSHFAGKTKKAQQIRDAVYDISFEVTGSELIAFLHESEQIKKNWPRFNAAQKKVNDNVGIFNYEDQKGAFRLAAGSMKNMPQPIVSYPSLSFARSTLREIADEYNLCKNFCGLKKAICGTEELCKGVCRGEENISNYNARVLNAIGALRPKELSFLIMEDGREEFEKSFVLIEDGMYKGYGFLDQAVQINSFEDAQEHLVVQKDNRDIQRIINQHLRANPKAQIIFKN